MRTVHHNEHKIEIFDSVEDLPILRFQGFNLNAMIDSGIGSDAQAFWAKIEGIRSRMRTDLKGADQELVNLYQCLQLVISKMSPDFRAFCFLVDSVNGRKVTDADLTDTGIEKLMAELNSMRIPVGLIRRILESVKKKLDAEFEIFFPGMSANVMTSDFYRKVRKIAMLEAGIILGQNTIDEIHHVERELYAAHKAKDFSGANGLEAKTKRAFEDMCAAITKAQIATDPRRMSVFSFYRALEIFEKTRPKTQNQRPKVMGSK